MWPNAFGEPVSVAIRTGLGHLKTERAETGAGRRIGGNREQYVESLSCGVFLQRNSSRAHIKLSVTVLPPDGRQRIRRIFYFKRHLPTRNLDDFQMGIGCWPLGIVYWMGGAGGEFFFSPTSPNTKTHFF